MSNESKEISSFVPYRLMVFQMDSLNARHYSNLILDYNSLSTVESK